MTPSADIVIPTVGRASLPLLLAALDGPPDCLPDRVIVVDDRPRRTSALPVHAISPELRARVEVLSAGGRGPAAARNVGWRAARSEWVAFLDDDVIPCRGWLTELRADLTPLGADVGGSQGRIRVPRRRRAAPSDRERQVQALETATWVTANLAYRRRVLEHVGGFDERFPHAYREDADLGLRIVKAGFRIVPGRRSVMHPVWPASPWASVRAQAGNADDAVMRALHGRRWRVDAHAPPGRLARHVAIVAVALITAVAILADHPLVAAAAFLVWCGGTAELAWHRIARGPRTQAEIDALVATSVLIPFAAVWHRARGELRAASIRRRAPARRVAPSTPTPRIARRTVDAVFFDRDGTLVHDVPDNDDPRLVRPVEGAREAVARLRDAGVLVAVVTNQAAVGEGRVRPDRLRAVNARIDELLGPFDVWLVCPHAARDACDCRKPAPGLVERALATLDVRPERCALIGDTGADVAAARAAGVRAILVPTAVTRRDEIAAAPEVAPDLLAATSRLLDEPAPAALPRPARSA